MKYNILLVFMMIFWTRLFNKANQFFSLDKCFIKGNLQCQCYPELFLKSL